MLSLCFNNAQIVRSIKQTLIFGLKVLGLGLTLFLYRGQALAAEQAIELIPVQNRTSAELASILRPLLNENEVIIANRSQLIVKASPLRIETIRRLIAQLDTRPHRLMISVIQGEDISLDELNAAARFGVRSRTGNWQRPEISARGHIYQTQSEASLGVTQKLQTLEGSPAVIKVGEQFPVRRYPNHGYSNFGRVIENVEYREATTGFAVIPRLTGDEVTLEISPWSERLDRSRNGRINTQKAQTTLRTALGKWVKIGGVDETASIRS